jgi:hypothetical protein
MGRWTDSLNLYLVTRRYGRSRDTRFRSRLYEGQRADGTPDQREIYLGFVVVVWGQLVAVSGVAGVALAYVLYRLEGDVGKQIAVALVIFVAVFCLAGMADAVWRIQLVGVARRRSERTGGTIDDLGRRLIRISMVNDGTLLLQLAAGAFFAWRFR